MQLCYYDGLSLQNQRKSNMDCLLLKERMIGGERCCLAAVCDGVGSLKDGAFASAAAVQMLISWLNRLESGQRIGLRLRDELLHINQHIIVEARTRGFHTASTLSALLLVGEKYYIAHVGDSRIYCLKDGELELLTCDQVRGGKLAACLGRSEQLDVIYNEGECGKQAFLVCSDGLYKRMDMSYLHTQLSCVNQRTMRKTLERLIQFVVERGEKDNISLALVICES